MTVSSPALRVSDAPVFRNYNTRSLTRGIGHVPQTSLPWQRAKQKNVYLAAHRLGWPGTDSRLIFYNLDKLEKGDKVSLKNRQGDKYRYRVTEKLMVDPSDSWVMGEVRGKDLLTLQTCTPIPTFNKRLIVRAERI
jgi:sortase A